MSLRGLVLRGFGLGGSTPPPSPTLAVADNADGTGAVATVSAGDSSAVNALFYRSFDGGLNAGGWTAGGTRTGNGTIPAAIPDGYYWWYVTATENGSTSISNLVYQPVTDGKDALHDRIFDAVQARALALAMPGIVDVYVKETDSIPALEFPCLLLTTFGKSETEVGGTNRQDDRGYPVSFYFLDREPGSAGERQDIDKRRHLNRQKFLRAMREQLLPGVNEVMTCRVEPDAVTVSGNQGKLAVRGSGGLLRFITREPRGFGA